MLIGYITKEMFNDASKRELRSPVNLKTYTVPLDVISTFDIGREVFLNEAGEIELESMKSKIRRSKFLYEVEKIENKAIVNINTSGEYIEPTPKLSTDEAAKVNKDAIEL